MPVLSELMAEVEPSVSTERRRLTMAPAAASVVVPPERIAVTTAGRPVGMAETEKAMAVRNSTSYGVSRHRPMPIEMSSATPAMTRIWFVSALSCRVSGVTSSLVVWSIPLMCPTSVVMPVLVTRIVPAPRVTWVFMNARSIRSPRAASAATASTCLGTGTLSPVSADSSISRVAAVSIRPSAGTRSPASMLTMSPGTSSSIGTEASLPSRRTLALTIIIFWSAATLAFALPSWLRPMAALKQGQADEHDAGRDLVREEEAEDARDQQDDLHRVLVLAQERLPARLLRRVGEVVRSVLGAAGLDLGGREALRRA